MTAEVDPFKIARNTSDDISGIDVATDFRQLKNLKLKVDGGATITIGIDGMVQRTIEAIAAHIQNQVRSSSNGHLDFSAFIEDGKLVLLSGTAGNSSDIELPASGSTAKGKLKLNDSATVTKDAAVVAALQNSTLTTLAGGTNGSVPVSKADYDPAFAEFKDNRNINIVLIPDHAYDKADPASKSILDAAKAHC